MEIDRTMTAAPGPTSHAYFSQRLRLHYVDWGNPDAPPMLMVHGGRDHCRNWDWIAQALRDDYHIIAPDLRGHGDSEWLLGGSYTIPEFVYDIAQLIDQTELKPLTIIAHSLGGMISLQYAGLFPENVVKLVAIEGLGPSRRIIEETAAKPIDQRMRDWVDFLRKLAGRTPRKYASLDEAVNRMQEANPHLSAEQARHLTVYGVNRNEDGTYSWKFDNYVRAFPPTGYAVEDAKTLWSRITCPTLLVYGAESWATDPREDGRVDPFKTAEVVTFEKAGHWVHHDQLAGFLAKVGQFLAD
jgi:pimeloyl-ACP methyl ester carboxylesterase